MVQQRDKYRMAYPHPEVGPFVNAWLVKYGYAQVMTVSPNVKHQKLEETRRRQAVDESPLHPRARRVARDVGVQNDLLFLPRQSPRSARNPQGLDRQLVAQLHR